MHAPLNEGLLYLQPRVAVEDGFVDTLRSEFHVVQLPQAAHQVWAAPVYTVL